MKAQQATNLERTSDAGVPPSAGKYIEEPSPLTTKKRRGPFPLYSMTAEETHVILLPWKTHLNS